MLIHWPVAVQSLILSIYNMQWKFYCYKKMRKTKIMLLKLHLTKFGICYRDDVITNWHHLILTPEQINAKAIEIQHKNLKLL